MNTQHVRGFMCGYTKLLYRLADYQSPIAWVKLIADF